MGNHNNHNKTVKATSKGNGNHDDIKKQLIRLLENDPGVRKALKKIIDDEILQRDGGISGAAAEPSANEIRLTQEAQTALDKADDAVKKLAEANAKLAEATVKLERYESEYSALENAFGLFKSMDSGVLSSFLPIIETSSPLAFLLSGANRESMKLYAEKISMEWNKYDAECLDALNKTFDFLFEQFRLNNPDFRRIGAKDGDDFDDDIHARTAGSPPVGKIRRVIFDGYMNENGVKIIKSFVEIG